MSETTTRRRADAAARWVEVASIEQYIARRLAGAEKSVRQKYLTDQVEGLPMPKFKKGDHILLYATVERVDEDSYKLRIVGDTEDDSTREVVDVSHGIERTARLAGRE